MRYPSITGDPYADADARDRYQQERLSRYPICKECGEHIQDEKMFIIDGRYYCPDCVEEVDTEDYCTD